MIYAADTILPITNQPINKGAILVKDGLIVAVGDKQAIIKDNPDENVKDFEDAILMPGLVNLHCHLECSSFEFLAEKMPFSQWLGRIIEASRKMEMEEWISASRIGVEKLLEAGITCVADITRTGTSVQALARTNMPAVVYLEVVGVDAGNLTESIVSVLESIKSYNDITSAYPLKIGLSPHSPYSLSSSALKTLSELSRDYDLPLSIHLAETEAEVELVRDGTGPLADVIRKRLRLDVIEQGGSKQTPTAFMDSFGLINNKLVAAHGVWLSSDDVEILKRRDAAIAVCPTSNELLNTGEAPIARFIDHRLKFGIGTDSLASNSEFDLFKELRKIKTILEKQTKQEFKIQPLSAKDFIEMITIIAARILGFDDMIGSIESGMRADFVIIDYSEGKDADPYEYLVNKASKQAIRNTILAGGIVYSC